MVTNLKTIYTYREAVSVIQQYFNTLDKTKANAPRLDNLLRFLQQIETDMQHGGECIIELDKPRMDAIEERDLFIKKLQEIQDKADDI